MKKPFIMKMPTKTFSICLIVAAGMIGIGTVFAVKYFKPENGRGGFETPGLPQFSAEQEISGVAAQVADSILFYRSYRVKPGDMIGVLADEFDITQDTIISVNNIRQSRLLQVGQYLKLPNMSGVLYTVQKNGETAESIAENYHVDSAKCALVNNMSLKQSLNAGESVFVPDAKLDWVTRQEINGDLFSCPLHRWYCLSSPYGWRASPFTGRRSFHNGIDMAISKGTAVYAALAGRVLEVGYNETYGNYIIVSHYSGYRTLYGHLSAVLAVRGQRVTTSTCIGRVGNTGMSTGPHLHFTILKSGNSVNPLNLLK